jgi:2-phosphoglycerate kinase
MALYRRDWTVLLIGGPSGVGKSAVAQQLGRELGIPWLMVDDLRLALQRSRVTLPERTEALYFYEETPGVRRLPPERRRAASIAVAEVLSPAIEVVVENHIDQAIPAILEGDSIIPSLLDRPPVRRRATGGRIRAVFLIEPAEDLLLAAMRARGRWAVDGWSEEELRLDARAMWLYGQWVAGQARRRGLPVLAPRPWATLAERLTEAAATPH